MRVCRDQGSWDNIVPNWTGTLSLQPEVAAVFHDCESVGKARRFNSLYGSAAVVVISRAVPKGVVAVFFGLTSSGAFGLARMP
jgi:hypothetical protein